MRMSRSRVDIIRSAFVERGQLAVADDPSLLPYYLRLEETQKFITVYFEKQRLPDDVQPLINHALLWLAGRRPINETYLLSAADVDGATTAVVGLTNCVVEANVEALRCYDALLAGNPIGPLGSIGLYANNEPLRNDTKRLAKRRETEERPITGAGTLALSPEKQTRFDKLKQLLPTSADILYEALCRKHHVTLELLLLAAENSQLDPKTRWQMATIITKSFELGVRMRGFVRTDFIRMCAIPIRIRGVHYYYLGADCLRKSLDGALLPPIRVYTINEAALPVAATRQYQDIDDDVDDKASQLVVADANHARASIEHDECMRVVEYVDEPAEQEAQQQCVFLPPSLPHAASSNFTIADNTPRRTEHLLDLLRTQVHLDTSSDDLADIDEIENAAKHRFRVLMTVYDLALGDADGSDEAAMLAAGRVTKEDMTVLSYYPRGYHAPFPCHYAGAPGLRAFASHAAYAAMGLGILCIVVRAQPLLQYWLLYAEGLLLGNKKSTAEVQHHLSGVAQFISHTAEPDATEERKLSELVIELRESIERKLPLGWREKIKVLHNLSRTEDTDAARDDQ